MCPNLENFMDQQGNPGDLHGIQDGYGLAISEFLGNDIQGCPAAQGDISNLGPFHDAEVPKNMCQVLVNKTWPGWLALQWLSLFLLSPLSGYVWQ